MRHDAAGALRLDDEMLDRPYERRFDRSSGTGRAGTATALRERPAAAPGRAYGTHRRADGPRVAGPQPGRRTVEIRGQVQAPRRRSQTQAALIARPDRTAQWAFLFALFLLVMAIATAHG
jgi:hypothetical protein